MSQGIVPTTIIIVAALGLTYRKDGMAHPATHESTIHFGHSHTRASRPWASTLSGSGTDVDAVDVIPIQLSKAETKGDIEARTSATSWQKASSTSTGMS